MEVSINPIFYGRFCGPSIYGGVILTPLVKIRKTAPNAMKLGTNVVYHVNFPKQKKKLKMVTHSADVSTFFAGHVTKIRNFRSQLASLTVFDRQKVFTSGLFYLTDN